MADINSMEVIQRFRESIHKAQSERLLGKSNRGNKLQKPTITSKVVEYDGKNHLVNAIDPLFTILDVLAPLAHPSEILTHPAISATYKSTIYQKLASDLIILIETEQNTLNYLNRLLSILTKEDMYYNELTLTDDSSNFFQIPTLASEIDDSQDTELIDYLQAAIQRQSEYLNNLLEMRNGIVEVDRIRKELVKWAKEMQ